MSGSSVMGFFGCWTKYIRPRSFQLSVYERVYKRLPTIRDAVCPAMKSNSDSHNTTDGSIEDGPPLVESQGDVSARGSARGKRNMASEEKGGGLFITSEASLRGGTITLKRSRPMHPMILAFLTS